MANNCKRNSWIAAVVLGIIVFLVMLPGIFWAFVLGLIVALLVGFGLTTFLCKEDTTHAAAMSEPLSEAAVAAPDAAPAPTDQPDAAETADRPANSGVATAAASGADAVTSTDTGTVNAKPAPIATTTDAKPAAKTPAPAAKAPAKKSVAVKPAAKSGAKKAASKAATPVEDVPATADVGTKPEGLSAPRDGAADDLRMIKGVGPKLQTMLNEMGYFHFDQIAAWTTDEIAWVDQNLKGFKGRVSRDNWVDQAKTLADGGATEFSSRVGKGDVY